MIGTPGSGKSYIAAKKMADVNIISRDQIRFSKITDKDTYFEKENEVWDEYIKQIKESLKNNSATVADATHLNTRSRAKLFRALGSSLKGISLIAYYIKTPVETCIERNAQREGLAFVPISAIRRMASQIEEPIAEEGWDAIITYDGKTYTFEEIKN